MTSLLGPLSRYNAPRGQMVQGPRRIMRTILAVMLLCTAFAFDEVQAQSKVPSSAEPTADDIARSPEGERDQWCIQEKIEYAPALSAGDGGDVKIEIRMMFLRPDDEARPILAQNLVRL